MKRFTNLKKKKRRGFTLVEMVIVVTILGVLSSLGFTKFGQVQKNAKLNADYVAASSLATATSLALQDNKKAAITTDGTIDLDKLQKEGYISLVPTPQNIEGDDIEFLVTVDNMDNILVNVDGDQIYPRVKKDNAKMETR